MPGSRQLSTYKRYYSQAFEFLPFQAIFAEPDVENQWTFEGDSAKRVCPLPTNALCITWMTICGKHCLTSSMKMSFSSTFFFFLHLSEGEPGCWSFYVESEKITKHLGSNEIECFIKLYPRNGKPCDLKNENCSKIDSSSWTRGRKTSWTTRRLHHPQLHRWNCPLWRTGLIHAIICTNAAQRQGIRQSLFQTVL